MVPDAPRPGRALWGTLLIGLGLAAAPAIFGMFSRAPAGGEMIADFEPYMRTSTLDSFGADLDRIEAAHREVAGLAPGTAPDAVADFVRRWPAIYDEMASMLSTIEANGARFDGLVALPPFWLFPGFFVGPGLMILAVSVWALRTPSPRRRLATAVLAVLGLSVVAAPAVFQMFTRAPGGAAMINDFRPLMTASSIGEIQKSFLVIAGAEGGLRNELLSRPEAATTLPATAQFVEQWPRIAAEMAPMIGAMADNLDNFAAVDALPPFWLFPWFFVLPGLLVTALALTARPRSPSRAAAVSLPAGAPAFERSSS